MTGKGNGKVTYVTPSEVMGFREMARIMCKHGYIMNHATARNVLMRAIENLVTYIYDHTTFEHGEERPPVESPEGKRQIKAIVDLIKSNAELQEALADILKLAKEQGKI